MPVFDTLRINQSHLAKVIAAKRNHAVTNEVEEPKAIVNFMKWRNHIRKQLTGSKALTSCKVVHTIE